jgi:hypothetical protein
MALDAAKLDAELQRMNADRLMNGRKTYDKWTGDAPGRVDAE